MHCFSQYGSCDAEFSFLIQIYVSIHYSQPNLVLPWIYQSALCMAAAGYV